VANALRRHWKEKRQQTYGVSQYHTKVPQHM